MPIDHTYSSNQLCIAQLHMLELSVGKGRQINGLVLYNILFLAMLLFRTVRQIINSNTQYLQHATWYTTMAKVV